MYGVEIRAAVRRLVFLKEVSRREVARRLGVSRDSVAMMCRFRDHLRPAVRGMAVDLPLAMPHRRAPRPPHPHVHILEMNGECCRLEQSAGRRRRTIGTQQDQTAAALADNPAASEVDAADTSTAG